ncbi:MAG: hypothetical protein QOK37_1603 [Thermoanaerobaculia bacterium]|jgi:uncharacterized protein YndB with AHSA1/START domain|nr:hypothetical protein [Thermoanaerobaculia bacterium]
MTQQKDFKRVVRTRMQKTGESYTTARLHLVKKQLPTEPVAPAADFAALAKLSDESVKKATGCDWSKWVFVLDKAGGKEMTHPELVAHIREKYKKTPGWWTQMVAVGYERIRGLRAQGQMRSGDWSVTKSKTIAVPLAKLYAAFRNARQRAKWLSGVKVTVRGATPNKSIRLRWEDGAAIDVGFLAKSESKSQVALEHRKLPTKADADRMRAFWSERLDALAAMF